MKAHWVAALCLAGVSPLAGQAAPRWTLDVLHRLGDGSKGADVPTFTDIRGLATGTATDMPTGTTAAVFVFDAKTQEVWQFALANSWIRRITQRGRGPGELLSANGMINRPGGGFVINDPGNGRLTLWSANGEHERQVPLMTSYSAYVWQVGWDARGNILERTVVMSPELTQRRLRRVSLVTGKLDTLPDPTCAGPNPPRVTSFIGDSGKGPGMMVPFLAVSRKTLDRSGNLWCTPGGEYRIVRFAVGVTDPTPVIAHAFTPEPIPKAERDSAVAVVDSFARRWRGNTDSKLIPTVRPAIDWLTVDDRGRLWVKRPPTATAPTRYDVWENGKLVGAIESPLRLAREIPILVVGDMFFGVALDNEDVQTVVVARITAARR